MTVDTTTVPKNAHSYKGRALVVAVANYNAIRHLPKAVLNDAREVSAVLTDPLLCGYDPKDVCLLLDGAATAAAIRDELGHLAKDSGLEDSVIVFFSGHGGVLTTSDGDAAALLAADFDFANPTSGALMEAELTDAFSKIRSQRLLILFDACHSGGAGNLKGPSIASLAGFSEKSLARLAQGHGRVIISSSRETEVSVVLSGRHHSLFSEHLLDALRGQADTKDDGLIRVFDVFNYVVENVRREYPAQHPTFKAHNLEDNFPVALERGGAKSSRIMREPAVAPQNWWATLGEVMPDLYPLGPLDLEIWSRAGGDLSRLRNAATPRASWFSALKTLRHGGGGDSITAVSLIASALEDYPQHRQLQALKSASSEL